MGISKKGERPKETFVLLEGIGIIETNARYTLVEICGEERTALLNMICKKFKFRESMFCTMDL